MIDYDDEPFDLSWVTTNEGGQNAVSKPIKMLRKKPDPKEFLEFIKNQSLGYQMITPSTCKVSNEYS